jgi:DNA/RNA endonuclease YhcR with UshA esterase domain
MTVPAPGFPNLTDYREAIQNPSTAFADPELQRCQPELTPLGLPLALSGGFAGIFHLKGSREWAVRCFIRSVSDLTERYRWISDFLTAHQRPFFPQFEYQERGICVQGTWYPIVKMEWVHGVTLARAVARSLDDPDQIARFRDHFGEIALELERLGMAHGDLADENILVTDDGKLVLVDYDGMYVPGMPFQHSVLLGRPGYQHPGRLPEHFDAKIDRYAAAVLFMSLDALALQPRLFERRQSADTLLFSQSDLLEPAKSPLLRELDRLYAAQPIERQRLWRNFRHIVLHVSYENVPSFERFLGVRLTTVVARTHSVTVSPTRPLLDATDRDRLLASVGQIVEVRGVVRSVRSRFTFDGQPCLFINFGNYYDGDFYVVIWQEALEELAARKWGEAALRPALNGELVSVTGLLDVYRAGNRVNPQIHYREPGQIVVLRPPQRGGNIVI